MKKLRYALLLSVLVAGVTSTVHALPENGFSILYFSDSSFNEVVGGRDLVCGNGSVDSWGIRTGNSIGEFWSCDLADYWCEHCIDGDCHETMCD